MGKESTILREEMKNDLMRTYREVVAQHGCRNQKEAYELTVTHPAPRFYVDARRAHQRISPMMRGDRSQLQAMCPLRREMYEAIFEKVLELKQKEKFWSRHPHGADMARGDRQEGQGRYDQADRAEEETVEG